ncbi:hypothetical protein MUP77_21845, partial [Candidatus Bathyarchaeota archaeon]|nr:hypothetical protein [Candidatus Bathyarchaeota archaeon]
NLQRGAANNNITQNTIESHGRSGISMWYLSNTNNKIISNRIANNVWGMYISTASNNSIYYNNFINNGTPPPYVYIYSANNATNVWDNGYPSGGNHFSPYPFSDIKSGVGQNVTVSDGIADVPYIIDANNRDRYPLMVSYIIIPEFPSALVLPLFLLLSWFVMWAKRRSLGESAR